MSAPHKSKKEEPRYVYTVKIALDEKWYENTSNTFNIREYLDYWIGSSLGFRGSVLESKMSIKDENKKQEE